jgi:hypothetical protein
MVFWSILFGFDKPKRAPLSFQVSSQEKNPSSPDKGQVK